MNTTAVFVSSTFSDLVEYRNAVRTAIRRLGAVDISMENFGSRDERPLDECIRIIRQETEILVGLYAHRYGFIPPGEQESITAREYRVALEARIPIIAYLIGETIDRPEDSNETDGADEKLSLFKEELKLRHIVSFFSRPDELATMVAADLGRYLNRNRNRIERLQELTSESLSREQRLLDEMHTGTRQERERAVSALRALGSEDGVQALIRLMLGPDPELADVAAKVLEWHSEISEGLYSPHADVRYWAAFRVGELALQDHHWGLERATDLIELIVGKAEEIGVLQQCTHSLAKIGGQDVMETLLELLDNPGTPPEIALTALHGPERFWRDGMFASSASYDLIPEFEERALNAVRKWTPATCAEIVQQNDFQYLPRSFRKLISAGKRLHDQQSEEA